MTHDDVPHTGSVEADQGAARHVNVIGDGLRAFRRRTATSDLLASLVLWSVSVPQVLAYASLAGMPPAAGIWAAVVGLVVYALLGSSSVLSLGPGSSSAALVAATVAPVAAAAGSDVPYESLAAMLAVLVGAAMVIGYALRLGSVIDFVAVPVSIGYMMGLGLTIAIGQLPKLLGVTVQSTEFVLQSVVKTFQALGDANLWSLWFGLGAIALLVAGKLWFARVPTAFVTVALAVAASELLELHDEHGVAVLGSFDGAVPFVNLLDRHVVAAVPHLLTGAVAIALLSFLESATVAQDFARQRGQSIDRGRELVAMGTANVASGLVGGFVVDGSVSRTVAGAAAGARSQFASLVLAALLVVTALAMPGLLAPLPMSVLAAIVIVAVASLLDPRPILRFWKLDRFDHLLGLASFVAVVVFGSVEGLMIGVGLSLLGLALRTYRPRLVELGAGTAEVPGAPEGTRVPVFRELAANPGFERTPGVLVVRFGEELFFANVRYFCRTVLQLVDAAPEPVHTVVVDAGAITSIDGTSLLELQTLIQDLDERGAVLVAARLAAPVRDLVRRIGGEAPIHHEELFPSVQSAVAWARTREHEREPRN